MLPTLITIGSRYSDSWPETERLIDFAVHCRSLFWRTFLTVAIAVLTVPSASARVEGTRHDFSKFAPVAGRSSFTAGVRKATARPGTCVYCHITHREEPKVARWARNAGGTMYRLYESSTLEATLQQPTGASRMCLSCHDGTLALSHSRSLPATVRSRLSPMARTTFGTDLSGHHPISFVYDTALSVRRQELADPTSLPEEVKLDSTQQLQCTSCHDAHTDNNEHFLVMDNRGSKLCVSCHRISGWRGSVHATSSAVHTSGANPWPHTDYQTVEDNGCANCHRSHAALHPEWLLTGTDEAGTCLTCHDGGMAKTDVGEAFRAFSTHPIEISQDVHEPDEDPLIMPRHVTCNDCHDPHSVQIATAQAVGGGGVGAASGIDSSGVLRAVANAEYEVCYKCHGLQDEADAFVTRQDNVSNTRLEVATNNESYHPIEAAGRNQAIEGLEPGYTASSIIKCSDCHGSGGGVAANTGGPHGSTFEPILRALYQIVDPSMEAFQSYGLCYGCHNRASLLADASGFSHFQHVVTEETSCAVCHDAHGSRSNRALINFLRLGRAGEEVITASSSGLLEFRSMGRGRGECFLTCHNVDHNPLSYPDTQPMSGARHHVFPAGRP